MFGQTMQQPYGGAYQFNGIQQPVPKVQNYLSAEEIKELQQNNSVFSLSIDRLDMLQAQCNHRSIDGTEDSLTFDPVTGMATCTICGYKFKPIDADESEASIQEATDKIIDILQTIKLLYADLPAGAAKEYFQIIPLIAKIPKLFEVAAKNYNQHDMNIWTYNQHNMGAMQMLQNLNAFFGASQPVVQPGMNPAMGMGQPMMGGAAPMPGAMPGYPNAAYQQPAAMNPFGFPGASQQPQYQPGTAGYQFQPNQASTPVAPTVTAPGAPAADKPAADTTVTQTVTP